MELNFIFFFNSVLLGVGLAMDAFSVSLADGLHETTMKPRKMCITAGFFALLCYHDIKYGSMTDYWLIELLF